jgi:hypothetical protein
MKRTEALITILLAMNTLEVNRFILSLEKIRKQGLLIDKIKDLAKQEGTLLGRIITFPAFGDGKCYYIITKVYTKTVQIDWLNYCDGWSDARCGHQAILDKNYALAFINIEDHCTGTLPKPQIICPIATASPERIKEYLS